MVGAAIGAAYAIYAGFFAPAPTAQETAGGAEKSAAVGSSKLKLVGDKSALAFWANSKTNSVYLLDEEGKIYKSFGEGRLQEVNTQTLADFNSLVPSPDGTKIIARFGYPLNETLAVFSTDNNSWERLPDGAFSAAFDAQSQKIAYLKNTSSPSLSVINLADKKTSEVLKLQVADGELAWATPNEVYIYSKPSLSASVEAWSVNINNRSIKKVAIGEGVAAIKLGGGDIAFKLAKTSLFDANLALMHVSGADLYTLPFKTLPQKCVFDKDVVYCAVPTNLPSRIELLDDYLKEKFFSVDEVIAYNTLTREQRVLFGVLDGEIDAIDLIISGNKLLFRNRYDNRIYSLDLK